MPAARAMTHLYVTNLYVTHCDPKKKIDIFGLPISGGECCHGKHCISTHRHAHTGYLFKCEMCLIHQRGRTRAYTCDVNHVYANHSYAYGVATMSKLKIIGLFCRI